MILTRHRLLDHCWIQHWNYSITIYYNTLTTMIYSGTCANFELVLSNCEAGVLPTTELTWLWFLKHLEFTSVYASESDSDLENLPNLEKRVWIWFWCINWNIIRAYFYTLDSTFRYLVLSMLTYFTPNISLTCHKRSWLLITKRGPVHMWICIAKRQ